MYAIDLNTLGNPVNLRLIYDRQLNLRDLTRFRLVRWNKQITGDKATMVGYLFISAIVGLIASGFAVASGASFWMALGAYSFVGGATLIFLPAVQFAARALMKSRPKAPSATAPLNAGETRNLPLNDQLSLDQQPVLRILTVDDDPLILDLIPMIATKAGSYHVTSAASGEEALSLLAGNDMPFECFLLDINMPGMNGIELCERVRKMPSYRDTPIIMLTGLRDAYNMADAFRAGATSYTTKPFDVEELGIRLEMAQEMKASREQAGSIPYVSELKDAGHRSTADGSLIKDTAFSNYLTEVSRNNLAEIQVFAIRANQMEAMSTQPLSACRAAASTDVAKAAVRCFDPNHTVMTYTDDTTLIVATSTANMPTLKCIEENIERELLDRTSHQGEARNPFVSISIGGPVQLQFVKGQGAATAIIDRAIRLAESRAIHKQGGFAAQSNS